MNKIIIVLIVISTLTLNLIAQVKRDTLINGLNNVMTINEQEFYGLNKPVTYITKNIKAKLKPNLILRNEGQSGLTISPIFDNIEGASSKLIGALPESLYEYSFDWTKATLQIGEYDFNNDKISEIVIAYGIRGTALYCIIFQYHEPANSQDAYRAVNWQQIGEFKYGISGTNYFSFVKDGKIYFPVGFQGYSEGFIYVDGNFSKFQ